MISVSQLISSTLKTLHKIDVQSVNYFNNRSANVTVTNEFLSKFRFICLKNKASAKKLSTCHLRLCGI